MPGQPANTSSSSKPNTATSTTGTASRQTNKQKLASTLAGFSRDFTAEAEKATEDSKKKRYPADQKERFKQLSSRYSHLAASANSAQRMLTHGPSLFREVHDSIVYANKLRADLFETSKSAQQTTARSGKELQTQYEKSAFIAYLLSHCPDPDTDVDLGYRSISNAFWYEASNVPFANQTDDHIRRRTRDFKLGMDEAKDSEGMAITVMEPQHLAPVKTDA